MLIHGELRNPEPVLISANLIIPPASGGSQLKEIVNAIVEDLSHGRHVAEHTKALQAYGELAAECLLPHLRASEPTPRAVAFYCLQYCWSPQAREAVVACLQDHDALMRHMAALVLAKHEGLAGLARLCAPLLEDPRPAIAGFAFERAEGEGPNLARMLRFMHKPGMWEYTWKYLPRYYDPALTAPTLRMLGGGSLESCLAAIIALLNQHKRANTIRQGLTQLLKHSVPETREITAEYLLWHGSLEETAALRAALATEGDPYAKAAMEAALAAIARREEAVPGAGTLGIKYASRSLVLPLNRSSSLLARYRTALELLHPGSPAVRWKTAFELYRSAEPFEPHWAFTGAEPPQDFVAAREARLKLQALLFAIPGRAFGSAKAENAPPQAGFRGDFCAEPAAAFMPPLRAYLDPQRKSYGREMEEDNAGFSGMIHTADDAGWHRDHRTVVAAGNGLVRQVCCIPSWGFMVVLEHRLPTGEFFCSLYAHLGPFVCVVPGEAVKIGQKIGSIGRSFTWENGGYIAHLHFAIHKGPFWQTWEYGTPLDVRYEGQLYTGKVVRSDPDFTLVDIHTPTGAQLVRRATSWICGYVSNACWEQKRHGWVDPQEFLKDHASG